MQVDKTSDSLNITIMQQMRSDNSLLQYEYRKCYLIRAGFLNPNSGVVAKSFSEFSVVNRYSDRGFLMNKKELSVYCWQNDDLNNDLEIT